ncbi:MAG: DUF4199 family protein [Pyrinomonadaceae bacterium]
MKIALKYGLMIALVVVVWVVVTKFLFPVSPESSVNLLGPLLFNLAAIVAIYLGIRASGRDGRLSFKEGLKTGMSISLVYALSACLFFFILFLAIGPTLMASEPTAQTHPTWQVALLAFAGMFLGALVFGLVFSAIISFLLVRARRG